MKAASDPGGQHFQDPPGVLLPDLLQGVLFLGHGKGELLDLGSVQVGVDDLQGQAVAVFAGSGGEDVGRPLQDLEGF